MRIMAEVQNKIVTNILVIPKGADGDKELQTRNGVEVGESGAGIGWGYDGKNFFEPEPTAEQIEARKAQAAKQTLRDSANAKLAALGLTPEEIAAITA
tara:strand:- start:93 stop:386 length:294 start_codon:yes stop_codon:yes gene_type:complete